MSWCPGREAGPTGLQVGTEGKLSPLTEELVDELIKDAGRTLPHTKKLNLSHKELAELFATARKTGQERITQAVYRDLVLLAVASIQSQAAGALACLPG